MTCSGVPVSIDLASVLALAAIVLAGYASIWGVPRILGIFR